MLAWLYHRFQNNINYKTHTIAFIILAIPCVMILKQPDLGTAILIWFLAGQLFSSWAIIKNYVVCGFGFYFPYLTSGQCCICINKIEFLA